MSHLKKGRPDGSTRLKKQEIEYAFKCTLDITIFSRLCSYCDTWTPPPTEDQKHDAARMLSARVSTFTMVPALDRLGTDDAVGLRFNYRPEGWMLIGADGWACPSCVKKIEAAL